LPNTLATLSYPGAMKSWRLNEINPLIGGGERL